MTCAHVASSTGASDVYVFSHVVRRDPHQKSLDMPKELRDDEPIQLATPAMFAHVGKLGRGYQRAAHRNNRFPDQSYDGAKILVNSVAEHNDAAARIAKKIKNHRWGIINAWQVHHSRSHRYTLTIQEGALSNLSPGSR